MDQGVEPGAVGFAPCASRQLGTAGQEHTRIEVDDRLDGGGTDRIVDPPGEQAGQVARQR